MNTVLQDLLRHQQARGVLRDRSSSLAERDAARQVLGIAPGRCGTRYRYVQGCRCPACRRANTRYHRERRWGPDTRGDQLAVSCWCEDTIVVVDRSEVVAGRTGSCGAPGCVP